MGNSITRNTLIIVGFVILIAGVGYYLYANKNKQDNNVVVRNSRKSCGSIVPKNVILQAQTIEDRKSQYIKIPQKPVFEERHVVEQNNYMANGEIMTIEQLIIGEPSRSYLNYYFEGGKIFYFRRDYREYENQKKVFDPNSKPIKTEISDFFLDDDQKVCIWYSDQKKQPNNAGIDEMIHYFISGL